MTKYIFYALMLLTLVCLVLFGATTLTNGGVVYKTFATHPDTPPSGGLLVWAKTDGTMQTTNSSGTDAGMGGGSGGAGPIVSAYNTAAYADFPATTFTVVTFDTVDFDTSAGATMHSGANPSRLIAPTAGYYAASCAMYMASGTTFVMKMRLNGTTDVIGSQAGASVGAAYPSHGARAYLHMAANDYVECQVYLSATDHPGNGTAASGASFQLLKLF